MKRPLRRTIAWAAIAFLLLVAPSCKLASSINPDAPRSGPVGSVTPAGIQILHPACIYSPHDVVTSGDLHLTDPSIDSQVALQLLVIGSGGTRFTKAVVYPNPKGTGTDVPFRIALNTERETPWDCTVLVDWAG